jgi:hypothetical protein
MGIATGGKLSLEKRIEHMLDEAIELADLGDRRVPAQKIAERIVDSETELVREAQRFWSIERLTWMISRRRRARWRNETPLQMVLPDPIFQGLPRTIFLRNGQRPRLDFCTVSETEDHLKLLRDRLKSHPRVQQMEAVVELHRKWAAIQRGISWSDAKRREAESREKG